MQCILVFAIDLKIFPHFRKIPLVTFNLVYEAASASKAYSKIVQFWRHSTHGFTGAVAAVGTGGALSFYVPVGACRRLWSGVMLDGSGPAYDGAARPVWSQHLMSGSDGKWPEQRDVVGMLFAAGMVRCRVIAGPGGVMAEVWLSGTVIRWWDWCGHGQLDMSCVVESGLICVICAHCSVTAVLSHWFIDTCPKCRKFSILLSECLGVLFGVYQSSS